MQFKLNENKFFYKIFLLIQLQMLALIIVLLIRTFVLIPIPISGKSMSPTLFEKDLVLMHPVRKIKRFDVIFINQSDGETMVKRIIGLPGDQLEYRDQTLYINNEKLSEPFLKKGTITNNFTLEEVLVEKRLAQNQYFVLGDERPTSKDSRIFGAVTRDQIQGKAEFVYYPLKHFGKVK